MMLAKDNLHIAWILFFVMLASLGIGGYLDFKESGQSAGNFAMAIDIVKTLGAGLLGAMMRDAVAKEDK